MSDYINWGDVAARYPVAAKKAGADEMAESYIEGAEALMNSYLTKKYTIPVPSSGGVSLLLKDVAIDLTYAKMALHNDKAAVKVRDNAMAILKNIVEGTIGLIDGDGNLIPETGDAVWSSTQNYHESFGHLPVEDQLVDPDLVEDEYNARN